MKFLKRCSLWVILLLASSSALLGQENGNFNPKFAYNIEFGSTFNNLESSLGFEHSRTLFGVKVAPEVGVNFDGKSSIMGGATLIQNFGETTFPTLLDYTLYYKFENQKFGAVAGSFNRANSLASYPLAFFREDIYFYDPNIEGLMLQYKSPNKSGFVELFVDWYKVNRELNIDQFFIVASTEYNYFDRLFGFGANFLLNHVLDKAMINEEGTYLLERGQYNLFLQTDFTSLIPEMESLLLRAGALGSLERKRRDTGIEEWLVSDGYEFNLVAKYRGFGVDNSFYFGKGQFLYHDDYGVEFYPGNPFYKASRYNRTNLFYQYENKFLTLKAQFLLHFTKGNVANQQILTLGVNLGGRQ